MGIILSAAYFQKTFSQNTSGWLLLNLSLLHYYSMQINSSFECFRGAFGTQSKIYDGGFRGNS